MREKRGGIFGLNRDNMCGLWKILLYAALLIWMIVPCLLCLRLQRQNREQQGQLLGLQEQVGTLAGEVDGLKMQLQAAMRKAETLSMREPPGAEHTAEAEYIAEAESIEEVAGVTRLESAVINGEPEAAHKVYLTFDDGPSNYTEEILKILDRYQVKATFFVTGKEGERYQELMREIVEGGHTLGMHSYTHRYSEIYSSEEAFVADFEKLQDYLCDVTGVESIFYRFPGGSSNGVGRADMKELAAWLEDQGVIYCDWNVSSQDTGGALVSKDQIVRNCLQGISSRPESIILMHDAAGKWNTVAALPEIIENILAQEDTVILPITEYTVPVQHIKVNEGTEE